MLSGLLTNFSEYFPIFLLRIPIVLLAISVHEASHGLVADKLGDPTARSMGRISLNPFRHLDVAGAICMLLFGFGWASPVPIYAGNFKHPKRDMALTALAGPLSNFIMGFIGVLLWRISIAAFSAIGVVSGTFLGNLAYYTILFFDLFAMLNISFAVFNLIPIPPLDGSRVLFTILPPKFYFGVMKYERYMAIAFMVLLFLGVFDAPLGFLTSLVWRGFNFVVGLVPFL